MCKHLDSVGLPEPHQQGSAGEVALVEMSFPNALSFPTVLSHVIADINRSAFHGRSLWIGEARL